MKPDTASFRDCLGRFATGVTIVTYQRDGVPRGATVSSFTSVSLEPPLVLVGISVRARAGTALPQSPFTVNVLSSAQRTHALHFSGRNDPQLLVDWDQPASSPRLVGCVAYVSCRPWATHVAGDHLLVIGEVEDLEVRGDDPLVFYDGGFRALEETGADDEPPERSRAVATGVLR
jgi:flavin reductase